MNVIARLWAAGHAAEDALAKLGTLFVDPDGKRFGWFNNESNGLVSWFPKVDSVGNRFTLNQGQRLSGTDSTGADNPIVLDWAQAGTLRIIDTTSNTVIGTFNISGQVFPLGASLGAGSAGNFNYLMNAAFQVRKSLITGPASYSTQDAGLLANGLLPASDTNGYWRSPVMLAPNWLAFRKNGAGKAAFSVVAGPDSIPAVRAITSGAVTGTGVRMYCYDYASLLQGPFSFSQMMNGPVGSQCTIRVLTELGGIVATKTITGTGAWHAESIDAFNLSNNGSKWLAVDVMYNPGANSIVEATWYAQKPQITLTPNPVPFQARAASVEKTYVASFYQEAKINFESSTNAPSQKAVINTNFVTGFGTPRVDYSFSTGESANVNADANVVSLLRPYTGNVSFNGGIGIPAPPSSLVAASVRINAYIVPDTDLELA